MEICFCFQIDKDSFNDVYKFQCNSTFEGFVKTVQDGWWLFHGLVF